LKLMISGDPGNISPVLVHVSNVRIQTPALTAAEPATDCQARDKLGTILISYSGIAPADRLDDGIPIDAGSEAIRIID
jgi:hypothetical protein